MLAKKGATYQNVYFGSGGAAGKFVENIFAFPTTYVVDRNGNIVGDPIVGAPSRRRSRRKRCKKLIDQAIANSEG